MNPEDIKAPGTESGQEAFTKALQDKMLGQAEAISSSATGIESKVGEAIVAREEATKAGAQVIESKYGREIATERVKGEQALQSFQESQRGFGVNMAAYRQMHEDVDKNLKDLEQRKQELILQNNATGAAAVSEMQMQSLKFKQEAMQTTFSNLLGMASWSTQAKAQELASRAQSFTERSTIANIALQYGVPLAKGDTMESVISKAAPFASDKQRIELARIQSEIQLNKAKAAEALQGTLPMAGDASSIEAFANAARFSPDFLGTLNKRPDLLSKTINRIQSMEQEGAIAFAQNAFNAGMSVQAAKDTMAKNLTNYQRSGQSAIEKIIDEEYRKAQVGKPKEKRKGVLGAFASPAATTETVNRTIAGLNSFLFGE